MPIPGTGIAPAQGAVYNELASLNRRAFLPKVVVQLYNATPTFMVLLGNAQRSAGGLNPITVPVQGNSMVQGAWVGYSGLFNKPQIIPGVQNAQFNTTFFTVPVPLVLGEAVIQATEAVVPILDVRMNDVYAVMVQQIGSALFTNNTNQLLMPSSFYDAYDSGANAPTYGGIDRTAAGSGFWASNLVTGAGAVLTRAAMGTYLIQATALAGGETPDMVIMSPSDFAGLNQNFVGVENAYVTPGRNFTSDTEIRSGFPNININGVPFFMDQFCPKGSVFFVNTKYMAIYINEDAQFDFDGFYSLIPLGQMAKVGVAYVGYNVVCTKPVSGLQLTGITGQPF